MISTNWTPDWELERSKKFNIFPESDNLYPCLRGRKVDFMEYIEIFSNFRLMGLGFLWFRFALTLGLCFFGFTLALTLGLGFLMFRFALNLGLGFLWVYARLNLGLGFLWV